jgi:hypothetical protein
MRLLCVGRRGAGGHFFHLEAEVYIIGQKFRYTPFLPLPKIVFILSP